MKGQKWGYWKGKLSPLVMTEYENINYSKKIPVRTISLRKLEQKYINKR